MMRPPPPTRPLAPIRFPGWRACWLALLLLLPLLPATLPAQVAQQAAPTGSPEAAGAALRARHGELAKALASNVYQRPLYIDSAESQDNLKGDVYAVVEHPFATVAASLKAADNWCDVLILHLNTKYCRARAQAGDAQRLVVRVGTKRDQPLEEASLIEFAYTVGAATPEYFEVRLNAPQGPLGTRDYRILLEAVPLDGGGRTFLHLRYAYAYGFVGRVAMQGYLATVGSDKVGFSVVGRRSDGQPEFIGGVRGVVERNTMRYYLAIDAYLAGLGVPAAERTERRLELWFAATERYARQLHEIDRASYLEMKRNELQRQAAG